MSDSKVYNGAFVDDGGKICEVVNGECDEYQVEFTECEGWTCVQTIADPGFISGEYVLHPSVAAVRQILVESGVDICDDPVDDGALRLSIFSARPGGMTRTTATPSSNDVIEWFGGGHVFGGVTFTQPEMRNLIALYGYGHIDPQGITENGNNISLMRHVQTDGMRMMAAFARFITHKGEGCDPVREMLRMISYAGIDIGSDSAWVFADDDDGGE